MDINLNIILFNFVEYFNLIDLAIKTNENIPTIVPNPVDKEKRTTSKMLSIEIISKEIKDAITADHVNIMVGLIAINKIPLRNELNFSLLDNSLTPISLPFLCL